jgi:hypothetical protein
MGDNIMWNNRIIKDADGYGLYEVFYNDDDEICAHSEKAEMYGDSIEEIISSLEMMIKDAKKHQENNELILKKDEIQFKDWYDPKMESSHIDIEDLNLDE